MKRGQTKSQIGALRQRRDARLENTLRPRTMEEFVGQERARRVLRTALAAAKSRQEELEHVLLHGGPGLGKTSLAMVLAREMGVRLHISSGAALERGADVLSQLNELGRRDMLFIDEIHRLKKPVEELLYPALEDFRLDINLGKGVSAKALRIDLERFTMVGATTHLAGLSSPFRNRFGIVLRMEPYSQDELARIVKASASRLKCRIIPDAIGEIAKRSRGVPRIANHLLKRSRDYAQAHAGGVVVLDVVRRALEEIGIDEDGLDEMDRRILSLLVRRYGGGPVGLKTLAIAAAEEPETLEDFYEPYLIQAGYVMRTAQGRRATPLAKERFGRRR